MLLNWKYIYDEYYCIKYNLNNNNNNNNYDNDENKNFINNK